MLNTIPYVGISKDLLFSLFAKNLLMLLVITANITVGTITIKSFNRLTTLFAIINELVKLLSGI